MFVIFFERYFAEDMFIYDDISFVRMDISCKEFDQGAFA
jgi:hypothetical protein